MGNKESFRRALEKLSNVGVHLAGDCLRVVHPSQTMINADGIPLENRYIVAPFSGETIQGVLFRKPSILEPTIYGFHVSEKPPVFKLSLTDNTLYDVLLRIPSDKEFRKYLDNNSSEFYAGETEEIFPSNFRCGNFSITSGISYGNVSPGWVPSIFGTPMNR